MKYFISNAVTKWSLWVCAFWSFVGALIIILSALLYEHFDWKIGFALIACSVSIGIARYLKQPGADA